MSKCTQESLRFPPVEGLSVRAEFDGSALATDFGPLLLRGVDRQIGLTERLAAAFDDRRHPSYVTHPLRDLFAQRVYQIACAYEDTNDANSLRSDPLFKLGLERRPLDDDNDLASAATFSRLENSAPACCRQVGQGHLSSDASFRGSIHCQLCQPSRTQHPGHGSFQRPHPRAAGVELLQSLYYRQYCYLPLFIFEGLSGKFVTAALRPGKRPSGVEKAMILKRVLKALRRVWPETHILIRGDSHFANPELMALTRTDSHREGLPLRP